MDEENDKGTEPQTEPQGTEPSPEPKGDEGKGKPDAAEAAKKYKAQRDEARQQIADLEKQVAEYKGNNEIITKLQADLKKTREEAEARAKQAEADRVNSNRLTKAGCVDVEVALGLLDENGDVDKLMEQKPYLFTKKGSTGLPPSGQGGDAASIAKAREAAGLPPIKN